MKLIHKNFFYTSIVTGLLTVLILGYFVFMLPSLYVDYMSTENYDAVVKQHRGYLKEGSYKNVPVKNPSCMTIEIPFSKDSFTVTGKMFQMTVTPTTEEMKALLTEIKTYVKGNLDSFKDSDQKKDKETISAEWEKKASEWKEEFRDQTTFLKELPMEVKLISDSSMDSYFWDESTKLHFLSDDTIIIEAGVSDGKNHYTNYAGITFDQERIVISYLPAMTPQMDEITPIVLHSLPMLLAVIVLFALVVSYLYSKGIVDPIIRLVKHTEAVKRSGIVTNASLKVQGKDEIAILVQTLNELYEELGNNYKALENKNKELDEKNKRQEVFLRSSSHQLKTPIAAALLLVEGMMNQIGKYKDVETYLPEVKKQLLSMRKIVEDVLYLSRQEERIAFEQVNLTTLVENQLSYYQVPLSEGKYNLITEFSDHSYVNTDSNLVLKIVDNLILNALVHSKEGATIKIITRSNQFEIYNSNAHIDEDMMPNIFEPFVSRNGKGHGLGLYIVAYYANLLGVEVKICNEGDGVLTKLSFPSNIIR